MKRKNFYSFGHILLSIVYKYEMGLMFLRPIIKSNPTVLNFCKQSAVITSNLQSESQEYEHRRLSKFPQRKINHIG